MEERPTRYFTDRDLRALTTDELLTMIRADIRELDSLAKKRHPTPVRKSPPVQEDEVPEAVPFHQVICCNSLLGYFPAIARVRCPFCGEWHKAGDFPLHTL